MTALYWAIAGIGLVLLLLDFAAMIREPTPRFHCSGFLEFGALLFVIGAIGAGCVYLF